MKTLTAKHILFLVIAIMLLSIHSKAQNIVINEFMSSNDTTITDMDGDYSDWIELYNTSDIIINLENYSITDDLSQGQKWIFPAVEILANGYLLIFASGKDIYDNIELHTNFKIKQDGEELALYKPNGDLESYTNSISVPTDYSYGCIPNGSVDLFILNLATPNASNIPNNTIQCSHESGFYQAPFQLSLSTFIDNHSIHYTLNGATPTSQSPLYESSILIDNKSNAPDYFSSIPTTPTEGPWQLNSYIWQEPNNVYKANVIRFASFYNDTIRSEVSSKTYFVDPQIDDRYTFPIISIITDSLNLYQYDTGIYIPGLTYEVEGFTWLPNGNYHNRGIDWERDIHIGFFESDGTLGFETNAGMRMRGYGSVVYPQKSFGVYFRNDYGQKNIEYPLFPDVGTNKYKRLVVRNSGQDFLQTHFRDAVLQDIIKPMGLELQNFRPSVVFFNGEYWGIHGIRQKYDEDYFKYNFSIDEDSIIILNAWGAEEEGSNTEYFELLDFLENNDMSLDENYNFAKEEIDIENFINFQIAEIYYANYDWPCNNYKIWKTLDQVSKWRFLIYDLDLSFGYYWAANYQYNSLEHAISEESGWPHCPVSNLLFRKLLENADFEEQFLSQFAYHLNNTFEYNLVINRINEFKALFLPEIDEHMERWGYPEPDVWQEEIDDMITFARRRPCVMEEQIKDFFNIQEFDFECTPIKIDKVTYQSDFTVFPNPSTGFISIIHPGNIQYSSTFKVQNIHGLIVDEGKISRTETKIDLSFLESGIYFIILDNQQTTLEAKFIISR